MNARDLTRRAVVNLANAQKVGEVDDILFDAAYRQVLGFRVKMSGGGIFGHTEALPRDNVSAIGRDALTIGSPDAINDEDRFAELAHAVTLKQAEGTKVVTEDGHLLGTVSALQIDDDAHTVLSYVLAGSMWERLRHNEPSFPADEVLRIGDNGIMIVSNAAGQQLQPDHH